MQGQRQIKGACVGAGFQTLLQKAEVAPCRLEGQGGVPAAKSSEANPCIEQSCSCNCLAKATSMLQSDLVEKKK